MDLNKIGFNEELKSALAHLNKEGIIAGRVALEHKRIYRIFTEFGELLCEVSGKLSFEAVGREDYPAVGDWVAVLPRLNEGKGTIMAVLPRKSKFSRKTAGQTTEEQIVAANVDTIFLVNSLNEDLNLRRIERYLTLTWESGANPVILLTKSELSNNVEDSVALIEAVAFGVPVIAVSVHENRGLDLLNDYLQPQKTIALLGSSGVGKSTLTNYLLGYEKQAVQTIREDDDKGRHTTTYREMLVLPNGCVLIDTPGMRELQLWNSSAGILESFTDIEELAENCRFRDCGHMGEANCAVKQAIEDGELESGRLNSYFKMKRELAYLDRKQNKKAQSDEKKKWKSIKKTIKAKRK